MAEVTDTLRAFLRDRLNIYNESALSAAESALARLEQSELSQEVSKKHHISIEANLTRRRAGGGGGGGVGRVQNGNLSTSGII